MPSALAGRRDIQCFLGLPLTLYQNNSTFNTVAANSQPSSAAHSFGFGDQGRFRRSVLRCWFRFTDPQVATLAAGMQGLSTLRAITDDSGNVVFSTPWGQMGNLSRGLFRPVTSVRYEYREKFRV
jgi:hypothetical protein